MYMKHVLLVFMFMFSLSAFADATEVPAYMKDAVITVKLKSGAEYKFSGNTHAVVLRSSSNKLKPAIIVEKLVEVDKLVEVCSEPEKELNKNRIKGVIGAGPTGLKTNTEGTTTKVTSKFGPLLGIGYDRLLNEDISVNGQIMTNGTATLGLGLDF
jgi:hypothetical protein